MTKPHTRDLSIATQLGRVIAIMSDGKARTLRDIERECWSRYGLGSRERGQVVMPHLLAVDDLVAGILRPAVAANFTQSGADGGLGVGVAVAAPALALDVAQGAGLAVAHDGYHEPQLGRDG